MLSNLLLSAALVAIVGGWMKILAWRNNYRVAEKTGFRTFYSPIHITDMWWLVLYPLLRHLLKLCPESWYKNWLA